MARLQDRQPGASGRIAQVDSRKRLTVTEMTPGGLYRVTVRPGGAILLEPVVAVTLAELRARGIRP